MDLDYSQDSTPPPPKQPQFEASQPSFQALQDLYNETSPAKDEIPSIAEWIVPILKKHSSRIIDLAKICESNSLALKKLATGLEEKSFPPVRFFFSFNKTKNTHTFFSIFSLLLL